LHPVFRILIGAMAAFVATGAAPAAAAPATTVDYVALGDSYAAGTGAGAESTACRVTDGAYPKLWAATDKVDLTFAACSGADTAGVLRDQLGGLGADTDLVSITVGANDLRLVDTLRACAAAPQSQACTDALAAIPVALSAIPTNVGALLTAVHGKAPAAKIVVTGYPVPFADVAECPQLPLGPALREAGNTAIAGLNRALEATARAAAAVFVDVNRAFTGHAQCTAAPWLVGLEGLGNETILHPTLTGQTEGFLAAFTAQAGTVDEILAWIAERDTPSTPPSSAPAPSASGPAADAAAPPAGGSGGGLPVTGPALYSVVAAGVLLVATGAIAF
jgi:lysophospholipase L1-like esterase